MLFQIKGLIISSNASINKQNNNDEFNQKCLPNADVNAVILEYAASDLGVGDSNDQSTTRESMAKNSIIESVPAPKPTDAMVSLPILTD